MCGEHTGSKRHASNPTGSSPHVRGARRPSWRRCRRRGIIPACAGSTKCQCGRISFIGDHPRMCGEHLDAEFMLASTSGSSPHVRGALGAHGARRRVRGIIPACAGSTCFTTTAGYSSRDHPRMCGEHTSMIGFAAMTAGSSPHVRGAPSASAVSLPSNGIIPACAGST